jgi:hypothetical protein
MAAVVLPIPADGDIWKWSVVIDGVVYDVCVIARLKKSGVLLSLLKMNVKR